MTSAPAVEAEERSASPLSNDGWATLELESLSINNGSDAASLVEISEGDDVISLENYASSNTSAGSIVDLDTISNTSEMPSLVAPSLPQSDDEDNDNDNDNDNEDDDYNDLEHEYEDDDEHDEGRSSAITPSGSGWGSAQDISQHEYLEDQRIAEENRIYLQSHSWVSTSTSSLGEHESDDEDEGASPQGGSIYPSQMYGGAAPIQTQRRAPGSSDEELEAMIAREEELEKLKARENMSFIQRMLSPGWRELDFPWDDFIYRTFAFVLKAIFACSIACVTVPSIVGVRAFYQINLQNGGLFDKSGSVPVVQTQTAVTPMVTTPVFSTGGSAVAVSRLFERTEPNNWYGLTALPGLTNEILDQMMQNEINAQNKSRIEGKIPIRVLGDNHVLLHVPFWFLGDRRSPQFEIEVVREKRREAVSYSLFKVFKEVLAIRLAPEDAYGRISVGIRALDGGKLSQNSTVDLGTPWLKVVSWKKATQALSKRVQEEFWEAQGELSKAYNKLSRLDIYAMCDAMSNSSNSSNKGKEKKKGDMDMDTYQRATNAARDVLAWLNKKGAVPVQSMLNRAAHSVEEQKAPWFQAYERAVKRSKEVTVNLSRAVKRAKEVTVNSSSVRVTDNLKGLARSSQVSARGMVCSLLWSEEGKKWPIYNSKLMDKLRSSSSCPRPAAAAVPRRGLNRFFQTGEKKKE